MGEQAHIDLTFVSQPFKVRLNIKYNFLETRVFEDSLSTNTVMLENIYFYRLYANLLAYLKREIFGQTNISMQD